MANSINKQRILPKGQDFEFLRKKGLEYIRGLGSGIWSDHNIHDPGITILEVLSYAITELSYRAGFPVTDVFSHKPDSTAKDFFTAAEILTCNPVTVNDFRKLVIDRKGVQNAWLHSTYNLQNPAKSIPTFYYKCDQNNASYKIRMNPLNDFENKCLKGLYNVSLQLDEDDEFGDLNSNVISRAFKRKNGTEVTTAHVVYPAVEVIFTGWDYPMAQLQNNNSLKAASISAGSYHNANGVISFDLKLEFNELGVVPVVIEGIKVLTLPTASFVIKEAAIKEALKDVGAGSLALFLVNRWKKTMSIICDVFCVLHKHRNLCEDYVKFSIVKSQQIKLCADVELNAEADAEEVLAKIYYLIDRFLAPPVHFYSLKEMLSDKKKPVEDIYQGTILDHGFIDDEELKLSELKSEIHVSDLYRIIMSIESVTRVTKLLLSNYLDGIPQIDGEPWCLKFGGPYHLDLSLEKMRVSFYKETLPIGVDKNQIPHLVQNLRAEQNRSKLLLEESEKDLPVPAGTYMPLEEYYSIQNDFPLVYGIGQAGLSPDANDLRKAQAKQLKAFLMFFDQLLASYLAQLADAKNQLSVIAKVESTYAVQPLYKKSGEPDREDFPNVANIYKAFVDELKAADSAVDLDDLDQFQNEWNSFTDNDNEYMNSLSEITENNEQFDERRNRFLDHLIARFGETFTDYALLMYNDKDIISSADLIEDKEDFLASYPRISRDRGKAFQYQCYQHESTDLWQKDNISGLRGRLYKLLGIDDVKRQRFGYKKSDVWDDFSYESDHLKLKIGNTLVLENKSAGPEKEAQGLIDKIIENAIHFGRFRIHLDRDGFDLHDENGDIIASNDSVSSEKGKAQILKTIEYINKKYYRDVEGMHIFEHILLRPVKDPTISTEDIEDSFSPEKQCGHQNCDCPITDHYSFRMTIVLPFWSARFRNMDFREYVERTIRMETPAHILTKICWVSVKDMNDLEKHYLDWMYHNTLSSSCCVGEKANRQLVSNSINSLIKKLNNLTNVYPEIVLFNCMNPGDKGAAVLGRSTLGTFKGD